MTKKNQTTVNQILLGDNLGELADQLAGYGPVKLILIGVDENGTLSIVGSQMSKAEIVGILSLALERASRD